MALVSYSEDILSRHHSDIFDLLREIEAGHLSSSKQNHAIPEFKALVKQLGDVLSDPGQPAAMRLLHLRQREATLLFEHSKLEEDKSVLGQKNTELNDRERLARRDCEDLRARLKHAAKASEALERELKETQAKLAKVRSHARFEIGNRDQRIAQADVQIKVLERLVLEAQVDHRI